MAVPLGWLRRLLRVQRDVHRIGRGQQAELMAQAGRAARSGPDCDCRVRRAGPSCGRCRATAIPPRGTGRATRTAVPTCAIRCVRSWRGWARAARGSAAMARISRSLLRDGGGGPTVESPAGRDRRAVAAIRGDTRGTTPGVAPSPGVAAASFRLTRRVPGRRRIVRVPSWKAGAKAPRFILTLWRHWAKAVPFQNCALRHG